MGGTVAVKKSFSPGPGFAWTCHSLVEDLSREDGPKSVFSRLNLLFPTSTVFWRCLCALDCLLKV